MSFLFPFLLFFSLSILSLLLLRPLSPLLPFSSSPLLQLFRALLRPGDTVVDVGANIGAFRQECIAVYCSVCVLYDRIVCVVLSVV